MAGDEVRPQTGVVPWYTVTDHKGRRAFSAGQLRAAIADLDDDAPALVRVATDKDDVADDQIIVSAGYGEIDWGDGYGTEPDPIFALECEWFTPWNLRIRPTRPRRMLP